MKARAILAGNQQIDLAAMVFIIGEAFVNLSLREVRKTLRRHGEAGVERIKELTNGIGADSVLECVGTGQSMMQAIQSTRRGGYVGYVGVPHGVELNGEQLFYAHVHLDGGPAPRTSLFARTD